MIKFTKDDVSTNQKLESLLLRITNQLITIQQTNDARIAALQLRTETAITRLTQQQSQLSGNIAAAEGAFSRAFRQEPGAFDIWDEQNSRWISTTDGSPAQEGLITVDSQSFAGDKTFQDNVIIGKSLTIQGSFNRAIDTITTTTTLDATHSIVFGNAAGGSIVANLPAAASAPGRIYDIKKVDSSANTVTIDPNGSELIDDAATHVLSYFGDARTATSDNTKWWIL